MSCGFCNERCCSESFQRHFYTKEEKIKQLEKYLQDLKDEIKAVEEIIKKMKEQRGYTS